MGRPEEIVGGKTKTFRLPARLIQQLEVAAALRKAKVSDVAREILERNIRAYYEECRQDILLHLQDPITVVENDNELISVFDRCKDTDACIVPEALMRHPDRVKLLLAAFEAYKALQAVIDEERTLFSPDKEESQKLLMGLIRRRKKRVAKTPTGPGAPRKQWRSCP